MTTPHAPRGQGGPVDFVPQEVPERRARRRATEWSNVAETTAVMAERKPGTGRCARNYSEKLNRIKAPHGRPVTARTSAPKTQVPGGRAKTDYSPYSRGLAQSTRDPQAPRHGQTVTTTGNGRFPDADRQMRARTPNSAQAVRARSTSGLTNHKRHVAHRANAARRPTAWCIATTSATGLNASCRAATG